MTAQPARNPSRYCSLRDRCASSVVTSPRSSVRHAFKLPLISVWRSTRRSAKVSNRFRGMISRSRASAQVDHYLNFFQGRRFRPLPSPANHLRFSVLDQSPQLPQFLRRQLDLDLLHRSVKVLEVRPRFALEALPKEPVCLI